MPHPPSHNDPAVAAMTLDILGQVLNRADNPSRLGAYLTEEIRELTGARCVLLIQRVGSEAQPGHRMVAVNPERRRDWANSPTTHRLYDTLCSLPEPQIWRADNAPPTVERLRQEGFALSMSVPLNVGAVPVGTMLLLGLPDETHLDSVMDLLTPLSTIVALVLRNALFHERQEQVIAARTGELQAANTTLRAHEAQIGAVSYTHLTLPTIYSV